LYTLYLDESGDEGNFDTDQEEGKGGSSRYFTLGGIIVDDSIVPEFRKRMDEILLKYFPNIDYFDKFKLHYTDLRESRYPFDKMAGIKKKEIADEIFNTVNSIDCFLLSVTIDLYDHCKKYSHRMPLKPRAFSLILIKERYQYFLKEKGSRGRIIYEEYDCSLRKQVKFGYDYLNQIGFYFYTTLENIEGDIIDGDPLEEVVLQFADFTVYPAYRFCKSHNRDRRRFDEISNKYYNLNHRHKSRRGNLHV
jgi:hypothetical protein